MKIKWAFVVVTLYGSRMHSQWFFFCFRSGATSGGMPTSHPSLSSAPSADRYAALKVLDEELRETKTTPMEVAGKTEQAGRFWKRKSFLLLQLNNFFIHSGIAVNPFKNPFQQVQPSFEQQSYKNHIIPDLQSPFNDFASPFNTNDSFNGFYYNNNVTNGFSQQSAFGGKERCANPFIVSYYMKFNFGKSLTISEFQTNGSTKDNNPFLWEREQKII